MLNQLQIPQMYTPEQVATFLQLKKNTVYDLINRGEIVAKKIGKVYRISATSLYFALTGLDYDLYLAEKEDNKNIGKIQDELTNIRKTL
jgi:putative molybdopterin biosynthesis protein